MNRYFEGKSVLITGGLGFLGSNLAKALVDLRADVTIIDNLTPLYGGNLFNTDEFKDRVTILNIDVRDVHVIKPYVAKSDIIFHLAAQVSYIDSLAMPNEDLSLNAKSTLDILECCRKENPYARIVFSSSRMIYGKVEKAVITEDCPTNPLSLYGIHKLVSEKYLLAYYKEFGIPSTALRITNPYGPRQQIKHNKYSLVGWFIRQAMEGATIRIFGDGKQLRDYIFVDDIVEAMLRCTASEQAIGQVINLGSGHSSRFCDMISCVINEVGSGSVEHVPWPDDYEKIETGDVAVDITKLQECTGWKPTVSLSEGIRRTHLYYRQHIKEYV